MESQNQNEPGKQTSIGAEDPELFDMQVIALLMSLAERDGKSLGPSMTTALDHAARRLWEFWNEDEDEGEEGGPLSMCEGDSSPTPRPVEEFPDTALMFG